MKNILILLFILVGYAGLQAQPGGSQYNIYNWRCPIDSVWRIYGTDSFMYRRCGVTYAIKDSTGNGATGWLLQGNANVTANSFLGTRAGVYEKLRFKTLDTLRADIDTFGTFTINHRLTTAAGTATQRGSHAIAFRTSLWDGTTVYNADWKFRANASSSSGNIREATWFEFLCRDTVGIKIGRYMDSIHIGGDPTVTKRLIMGYMSPSDSVLSDLDEPFIFLGGGSDVRKYFGTPTAESGICIGHSNIVTPVGQGFNLIGSGNGLYAIGAGQTVIGNQNTSAGILGYGSIIGNGNHVAATAGNATVLGNNNRVLTFSNTYANKDVVVGYSDTLDGGIGLSEHGGRFMLGIGMRNMGANNRAMMFGWNYRLSPTDSSYQNTFAWGSGSLWGYWRYNAFTMFNTSYTATAVTDAYSYYSKDISAGNAAVHFLAEGGQEISLGSETGTQSNHDLVLVANSNEIMRLVAANKTVYFLPQTEPAAPAEGQCYWDDALNKLRCYDGSAWQNLW